MKLNAIIFDCDGVLVDSEIIYSSVEREYLANIGLHYETTEYQERFLGLNYEDFLSQLKTDYRTISKGGFPEDFAKSVKQECLEKFTTELISFNGVKQFLKSYQGDIAVASSSSIELLHKKLQITELLEYFDPYIYSGEQVARGKPAPDLFLYTASKLNKKPQECTVIEDSVNGVKATVAAGMEVWGFVGGSHTTNNLHEQLKKTGANKIFSKYTDLAWRQIK